MWRTEEAGGHCIECLPADTVARLDCLNPTRGPATIVSPTLTDLML